MLKSFMQLIAAICLFLAVLLFPTKIGLVISEIVQACWNIVITVGKNIRVPGESGTVFLGAGLLLPAGFASRLDIHKVTPMFKSLINLPTRLTAQAHASAAAVSAGSTRLTRAQVGSATLLGLFVFSASPAFAASSDKSQGNIVTLVGKVTKFILLILAAAVVGMAAWGAFLYVTSAGNSKRSGQAKDTIKNVFIGLALAASVFLIRSVVLDVIGGVDNSSGGGNVKKTLETGTLGK